MWVAALAAVGAVLGLAIIAAGGYLINRDGSLDALFGQSTAPTVVADSEAPAAPAAAATTTPAPAAAAKLELPTTPAPSAEVAATTPAPVAAPATEPARVAAAPAAESYDNPFAYCRAVGTIDYVDHRYVGPAVTLSMTRALLIPPSSARDRVRWRCVSGEVLACTSYIGPICDMAPSVIEMREFCERNPNVAQLLAPSGPWSCADGKPQLPADARWPIDERGFLPQGWVRVPDTESSTAG